MNHDTRVQQFVQDPSAYQRPPLLKDSFKALYRRIEALGPASILDIGCANGDFLHFLPDTITAVGIDSSPDLIQQARQRNHAKPRLAFRTADILAPDALDPYTPGTFDMVTIVGALNGFLDFRPPLERALSLRPKWILIHAPFNEAPIDTRHYHRLSGDTGDYQSAFSLHSLASVSDYLTRAGVRSHRFLPFDMETTLERNAEAPLRNYHVVLQNGERRLTNGVGILFKEYILEIEH